MQTYCAPGSHPLGLFPLHVGHPLVVGVALAAGTGSHSSRNCTAGVHEAELCSHDGHKCIQTRSTTKSIQIINNKVNEDGAFSQQPKGLQLFYYSLCVSLCVYYY